MIKKIKTSLCQLIDAFLNFWDFSDVNNNLFRVFVILTGIAVIWFIYNLISG